CLALDQGHAQERLPGPEPQQQRPQCRQLCGTDEGTLLCGRPVVVCLRVREHEPVDTAGVLCRQQLSNRSTVVVAYNVRLVNRERVEYTDDHPHLSRQRPVGVPRSLGGSQTQEIRGKATVVC